VVLRKIIHIQVSMKVDLMSPSGHSVTMFPNWVLYSHAGLSGTTKDLSS